MPTDPRFDYALREPRLPGPARGVTRGVRGGTTGARRRRGHSARRPTRDDRFRRGRCHGTAWHGDRSGVIGRSRRLPAPRRRRLGAQRLAPLRQHLLEDRGEGFLQQGGPAHAGGELVDLHPAGQEGVEGGARRVGEDPRQIEAPLAAEQPAKSDQRLSPIGRPAGACAWARPAESGRRRRRRGRKLRASIAPGARRDRGGASRTARGEPDRLAAGELRSPVLGAGTSLLLGGRRVAGRPAAVWMSGPFSPLSGGPRGRGRVEARFAGAGGADVSNRHRGVFKGRPAERPPPPPRGVRGGGTMPSAVAHMAAALGGSSWMWGRAGGGFSVLVLAAGIGLFWRITQAEPRPFGDRPPHRRLPAGDP